MASQKLDSQYRFALFFLFLSTIGGVSFLVGVFWSVSAKAEVSESDSSEESSDSKVNYPEKTQLDFDNTQIEGEFRNPGEFYFQHRPEEKFDSLLKQRPNFQPEMLRDVVFSQ